MNALHEVSQERVLKCPCWWVGYHTIICNRCFPRDDMEVQACGFRFDLERDSAMIAEYESRPGVRRVR